MHVIFFFQFSFFEYRAEALSALMMPSISQCASIAERELKLVSISKKFTKNSKGTAFLAYGCSVFLHICMVLWRISPHGGILTRCVRGQGNAQKKSDTQACHSECLHNGIILIVYILQICCCKGTTKNANAQIF